MINFTKVGTSVLLQNHLIKMRDDILCLANRSHEDRFKKLLEYYEQMPLEKSCTNYWKKLSKSTDKYERILSSIAKKYLAPPASTISVERLFSIGGQVLLC